MNEPSKPEPSLGVKTINSRTTHIILTTTAFAVTIAAFLRGNFLLGLDCGVAYAAITLALFWLCRTSTGSVSFPRVLFVLVFAVPAGIVMAFPAFINHDV